MQTTFRNIMTFISTPTQAQNAADFGRRKTSHPTQIVCSMVKRREVSFVYEQLCLVEDLTGSYQTSMVIEDITRIQRFNEIGFEVVNSDEVNLVLDETPELTELILDAPNKVSNYFDKFKLKLESHTDSIEGYTTLNILILNNLPTKEAFQKEKALFKEWLLPFYSKYNGKLNIREEFFDVI